MIQKDVLEEKMEDYRQAGAAPQSEPERQYYFMARARELVADMEEKLGRKPTCCVVTFGCHAQRPFQLQASLWGNTKLDKYSVNIPMRYYYKGKFRKGWVNIVNPFRGTWVVGTPGSGKTFSIIQPFIRQHSAKGFAMVVYDYGSDSCAEAVLSLQDKPESRKGTTRNLSSK